MSFSWSKDGSLLRAGDRLQILSSQETSTLSIRGVGSSDSGTYTCIGHNKISEERVSARLIVEGKFLCLHMKSSRVRMTVD